MCLTAMVPLAQDSVRNKLLAALAPSDFALLQPQLEIVDLAVRDCLIQPDQPLDDVYFIERGIASVLAVTAKGRQIEVGIVGREGFVGTPVVLGTDRTPYESFIQVEGQGLRIKAHSLKGAMVQSRSLHATLLRYVEAFALQTGYTALSNGSYTLEERLARWLLMCHDRLDGDELLTTHEFLSAMLGVRRAGVTVALHVLEGARIIRSVRGRIHILDRARLEATAGDSYGTPEAAYERLIFGVRPST